MELGYYRKDIVCPKCHKKVLTYDGRATIELRANCKKCKLCIIYDPVNDSVRTGKIPERNSSSGKMFLEA